jgi:poly(A) polymerase
MSISLKGNAKWLRHADIQVLLAALNTGGHEARVIGGAVRNALIGKPAGDIDFATTTLPDESIARVQAAGFKAVPTGYAHGTITAVKGGGAFEITTLRRDVVTDGRHAEVAFGTDWAADAQRRDFTINALSCDASGVVYDYCGGLADIETRTIRFIGNAETRIAEDYLRSLRFYRFFAYYGSGRPDADGIRATAKLKAGLAQLSAERVWSELKKLLGATDPSRALLWMRQAGVLTAVLPESENWGIDAVPGLVATEQALAWQADPLLRLMAITPPDIARVEAMAVRLKLSKVERDRVLAHASALPVAAETGQLALSKRLYREGMSGISDRLKMSLASTRAKALVDDTAMMEAAKLSQLLAVATNWQKPVFPVSGKDMKAKGFAEGAALGEALSAMETRWIDSGFTLGRDELLATLTPTLYPSPQGGGGL